VQCFVFRVSDPDSTWSVNPRRQKWLTKKEKRKRCNTLSLPEIEKDLSGSVDKNGGGDDSPVNPDEEENDHGDAAEGEEGVQQQRTHERHLRKNFINSDGQENLETRWFISFSLIS
jgi:hypothetical protein